MKIIEECSYNNGILILKQNVSLYNEIKTVLTDRSLYFGKGVSREIKKSISFKLNTFGWADRVRLSPSRLTINFMKQEIGLCLQLGNVARLYADILKLQYLYNKNTIIVGIIAVPVKIEGNKIGSNHAQYERLVKEIKLFKDIITLPIVCFGLET